MLLTEFHDSASAREFIGARIEKFPLAAIKSCLKNTLKNTIVMSIKKLRSSSKIKFVTVNFVSLFLLTVVNITAQMSAVPVPSPEADGGGAAAVAEGDDFTWWYISLFVLALGLGAAVYWMLKNKKSVKAAELKTKKVEKTKRDKWEDGSLDADKEMEWLRKNQKLIDKNGKRRASKNLAQKSAAAATVAKDAAVNESPEAQTVLPVFLIERVELARPFAQLPLSNDDALMSAIEQTHDEFEEDEEVRDLALRILHAFKTRNSVEALSQMALYDLSATLRSKAVTVLAEFNHESVFEFILLASADPTREVRAAAARAMSKLTFDRADAWTRIFETEEEGRMKQAARAAIESGFVEMSFDRLVHQDKKYTYEAFALMVLLVKSGETDVLFSALENHKNMNVRRAVLHVVKVTKDETAVDKLSNILEYGNLPLEMREEADKTIEEIGYVTV